MAGSAALSVYEMGKSHLLLPPDFGSLSKPTTTVDVGRLQAELRALHSRLALLEQAALNPPPELNVPDNGNEPSARSSGTGVPMPVSPTLDANNDVQGGASAEERSSSAKPSGETGVGSEQKGRNKKGATAAAAAHIQAEMHNLSERIEALAASARQRDKAQVSKENMAALRRSMETNKMQLAIASRVTSDELEQAVNANADKIVALQSAVDSALNDRFRRMQDMVHAQMGGLLQMVQALPQQQSSGATRGSHGLRGSYAPPGSNGSGDNAGVVALNNDSDDDDEGEQKKKFVAAITDVVQRLLREGEGKRRGSVKPETFQALQEDYETFKGQVEEKADRQDRIASALEDAQARLEEAEINVAAITVEMQSSAEELQVALDQSSNHQRQLEEMAKAASASAANAQNECEAMRTFVGESRREALAEARQEAESLAARAEGRARAEVQKARGDARTTSESLSERLKQLDKKIADEAETQRVAISTAIVLSEKSMASAKSASARRLENDASLERVEGKISARLDAIIRTQATSAEKMLERVAESDADLCRTRDELQRRIDGNQGEIQTLQNEYTKLRESARGATENLRIEVQDALGGMVADEEIAAVAGGHSGVRSGVGGGGGGRGRNGGNNKGTRGSVSGTEGRALPLLGVTLRKQWDDMAQQVVTLQRSGVGIATLMRKLEAGLHVLSSKERFWQAIDTKIVAHQRSVGDVCLQVEEATTQKRSRITLPKDAQACLAGNMQRVAKLIATKADYEVIREIAKLDSPEKKTGHDWDERVESLRQTFLQRFTKECRDALDKRAPETRTNFNGEEIRARFFEKMNDALRVALSKFAPTTPGATLFGKIKLKAKACVACDRPFTPSTTGRPGPTPAGGLGGAAVEPASLPDKNSHITKDTFRPHTSHGRLGSQARLGGSPDLFEPHASIYSVMTGGRASPRSPHVFRGGFKLPKHMKSPLHASEGENESPVGIGHASALLYKSQTMTGLCSEIHDGRPNTSGGMRKKGRQPSSPSHQVLHLSGASGGEDGGSIVSAFTMQTETTAGWGGRHGRGGRSRLDLEAGDGEEGFERRDGGRNGEVPQRDDDTCSRDSRAGYDGCTEIPAAAPYNAYSQSHALSNQQPGSVRLRM